MPAAKMGHKGAIQPNSQKIEVTDLDKWKTTNNL
jgi:hypothetical protein